MHQNYRHTHTHMHTNTIGVSFAFAVNLQLQWPSFGRGPPFLPCDFFFDIEHFFLTLPGHLSFSTLRPFFPNLLAANLLRTLHFTLYTATFACHSRAGRSTLYKYCFKLHTGAPHPTHHIDIHNHPHTTFYISRFTRHSFGTSCSVLQTHPILSTHSTLHTLDYFGLQPRHYTLRLHSLPHCTIYCAIQLCAFNTRQFPITLFVNLGTVTLNLGKWTRLEKKGARWCKVNKI